jgi:hypothetical protein
VRTSKLYINALSCTLHFQLSLQRRLFSSMDQRIDFFIASCEQYPKSCPVDNMRHCINQVDALLNANMGDIEATFGIAQKNYLMQNVIVYLYAYVDKAAEMCNVAESNDYEYLRKLIFGDDPTMTLDKLLQESGLLPASWDTDSKPTSGESNLWPFANYSVISNEVAPSVVTAIDYAFGSYDEDQFVSFLYDLNKQYPGAGTSTPVTFGNHWYSKTYYWPNVSPVSPIGNAIKTGIIAGQIYDPATPYIWTQEMRNNFKSASLLTSRSMNHGMATARERAVQDPACQSHIIKYFQTGIIDFVDGFVCESEPIGDSCNIQHILAGAKCTPTVKDSDTLLSTE